jgi:tetratricopeptide (TPR) repeat protein
VIVRPRINLKARQFLALATIAAIFGAATLGNADTRDADLVKQGTDALKHSDYDLAIARLSDAIRLAPDDAEAWGKRGEAYASKGDDGHALSDCAQAIKLAPASSAAYRRCGHVHIQAKDFERAIADYDTAIKLDPRVASAYEYRGCAYFHLSQTDRAISDYDQSLTLDPSSSDTYVLRGNAWLEKGDIDRARDDYNRAVQADPGNAYAYVSRGYAASFSGHLDDAIADYNRAIEIDPTYKEAYRYRDQALQYKGFNRWGAIDAILFGVAILAILFGAFRAGLLDSYSERSYKTLRDGRLAFYPYIVGRGYVVSAEQKAVLIRDMIAEWICGALVVPFAVGLGLMEHLVLVLLFFGVGYYGGLWWLTRNLERAPSDERASLGERYRTQARQFGWKRLWFREIFSGVLIAVGLYIAAPGMDASDRLLGLAVTAYFGLMAWSSGYMLWIKSTDKQ